jgi:hypothetical protein
MSAYFFYVILFSCLRLEPCLPNRIVQIETTVFEAFDIGNSCASFSGGNIDSLSNGRESEPYTGICTAKYLLDRAVIVLIFIFWSAKASVCDVVMMMMVLVQNL